MAEQSSGFDPYRQWLDAEFHGERPNYYEMLGLDPYTSDGQAIADACRRATNRVRSQRPGSHAKEWAGLLDELETVKSCLTDPQKKADYDQQLKSDGVSSFSAAPEAPPEHSPATPPGEVNPLFPPGMGGNESVTRPPSTAMAQGPSSQAATAQRTASGPAAPAGTPQSAAPFAASATAPPQPSPSPTVSPGATSTDSDDEDLDADDAPILPPGVGQGGVDPMAPVGAAAASGTRPSGESTSGSQPANQGGPAPMAVATPLPTGGGSAPLATATPIAQGTAASTAPAAVSPGGETSGQGAALPKATATPVSAGAEAGAENGGVEGAVSTTTNRPKKKKGVDKTSLTVMAVAAVVLLLAAGGYVLFGRGGGDDDDKVAKTPPAKKSPTTTPHDRPEDRPTQDNKPDQQAPGDGGPSPGPDEGSPTGIPTPEPPPVDPPSLDPPGDDPPGMKKPPETEPPTSDPPSTEPPTTQPPTTQPPSDQPPLPKPELAAVDSALKEARDALSRRNLGSARIKILQARRAAEHPYLVAKVRRTQRLQINVNKFWTAVREGLAKLSTGEVLKINNTEFTVESKDVERMQLTVKVAGAVEKTYELRDMSFELAQLLADKVLNPTDPMTKVLKGSVLLVDHRSETPKESARQMFAEAERAGAIVDMMTAVVDDTYDPTGQSGVDPSMIRPDEPTMTDPPSPKPDATELAKLEKALKAAKKAMATRDFPTARDELASAAEAAQLPEHKALLARLKEVYDLKLQAWKSVQVGLTKMKALEIIMIEGLEIPIVETDAQNLTVTVRAPGQNKKYGLPTMDHRLAFYAMDRARAAQFPETKMMKGALLAFDVHTARKFDANSLARGFWSDAGDQGEDVSGLLKVLEDDYEKVAP